MDDKSSDVCTLCSKAFTMTNRRHHCRACGRLCCRGCSRRKLRFAETGSEESACDVCVNKSFAKCRKIIKTATQDGEASLSPKARMFYDMTGEIDAERRTRMVKAKQNKLLDQLERNVEKTKKIEKYSHVVVERADKFEELAKKIAKQNGGGF